VGRLRDSLIAYRMVTKLEPNNAEAWLDYGDTLFELGYFKQSLKAFDRSIEANPHSAEPYFSRAKVLLVLNRTFEAIESLKNSFQLDPDKRQQLEEEFPGVRSLKEFRNLLRK
jgi:tetratricopeptide (TPR) repeat protein